MHQVTSDINETFISLCVCVYIYITVYNVRALGQRTAEKVNPAARFRVHKYGNVVTFTALVTALFSRRSRRDKLNVIT